MNIKLFLNIALLLISFTIKAQTWQTFTADNSPLRSNMVSSIALSDDGTVWFATNNGLSSYYNGTWNEFTIDNGLSNNKVNSVFVNPFNSSSIFIASDSGLIIVDVDSTGFTSQPEYIIKSISEILSDTILVTDIDGFDNNWIGTDKGLSVLTNSGVFNFNEENGFTNNHVNAINVLSENWAYIGTSGGGVSRLQYNGVDGITSASDIVSTWSLLASDTVLSIYVTDDTLRWYGTTNGVSTHFGEKTKDVSIKEGGSWWRYNSFSSGLIDNYVRAITQDNEGNMWFGTRKGISVLSALDSTWTTYTVEDGLVSNNIADIKFDSNNNAWIATDKGISLLSETPTSISNEYTNKDYNFNLKNYPNPFNPSTKIKFTLGKLGHTELVVYDILGNEVAKLISKDMVVGTHEAVFDGSGLSSGIYIYKIQSGIYNDFKKMILMK